MVIANIFETIGTEKKKINPKNVTPVIRALVIARATREIINERNLYSRMFEESAQVCKLPFVESQTLLMRGGKSEPALPSVNELIPDMFQVRK